MNVSTISAVSLTPATTRPTSASEAAAAAKATESGLTPLQQGTSSKALEDPNVTLDTSLTYTAQRRGPPKSKKSSTTG